MECSFLLKMTASIFLKFTINPPCYIEEGVGFALGLWLVFVHFSFIPRHRGDHIMLLRVREAHRDLSRYL